MKSSRANPSSNTEKGQSTSHVNLHTCIDEPAASKLRSNGSKPGIVASKSAIQIHSPTASITHLLYPNSASASRLSLYHAPSRSPIFTTSDISLVELSSASKSTSNLAPPSSNAASKGPIAQLSTNPYAQSRRQRPQWLRWLSDLADIDDRVLAFSVTITLSIFVLIGVPLGAILPQRYVVSLPINVLVPFYIYPTPGAWDRLYTAAVKHPTTNFTIILSPTHGPGSTVWPSGEYIAPIKHLSAFSNVRAIGYIDVARGTRANASVRADIATYAGWNASGIALSGVYFDRTPVRDEDGAREYLRNVSMAVRREEGFLAPRVVVHGAGEVPDVGLVEGERPDVLVVFEGAYAELPKREEWWETLAPLAGLRTGYGVLVHSVPNAEKRGGIRRIVDGVRKEIGWLFVTDQWGDEMYEDYGGRWEEFLSLIW